MSTTLSASSLVNPESSNSNPARVATLAASPDKLSNENPQLAKLMQSYQADQQLKYLHLQAEVEVLLQQLQTLKQRRLASTAAGEPKQ